MLRSRVMMMIRGGGRGAAGSEGGGSCLSLHQQAGCAFAKKDSVAWGTDDRLFERDQVLFQGWHLLGFTACFLLGLLVCRVYSAFRVWWLLVGSGFQSTLGCQDSRRQCRWFERLDHCISLPPSFIVYQRLLSIIRTFRGWRVPAAFTDCVLMAFIYPGIWIPSALLQFFPPRLQGSNYLSQPTDEGRGSAIAYGCDSR